MIEINENIVADDEICGGSLTFKGTRIMVWQVLELLATGTTIDEILRNYFPELKKEAIFAALNYASRTIEDKKYASF